MVSDHALAITLGLLSAFTLALANTAVKKGEDILVTRAVVSSTAAMIALPVAFLVPKPDTATWQALAWAIPPHFLYQVFLIQALSRGDLGLVFPIMRGCAPLLVALFGMVVVDEHLGIGGWLGLLVATGAVGVFAWPSRGVRLRDHPDKVAIAWALATALAVALYNLADARGVRVAPIPLTYITWLFLLDAIGVTVAALTLRRREMVEAVAKTWRNGMAGGALSVASFGSALYAFSLIEVAKVSALRETAVVWAALIGHHLLRESFGRRRLFAAIVLAGGLVFLQLD